MYDIDGFTSVEDYEKSGQANSDDYVTTLYRNMAEQGEEITPEFHDLAMAASSRLNQYWNVIYPSYRANVSESDNMEQTAGTIVLNGDLVKNADGGLEVWVQYDPSPLSFQFDTSTIQSTASKLGKAFVYDRNATFAENTHKFLDLAGFAPGIGFFADAANGGLYLAEGNYKEAGWSGLAAIPGFGDAVAAARTANKAGKLVEGLSKAAEGVADSGLKFTQTTASTRFSEAGTFSGKTIGEVANGLRTGALKATDVPVEYIERDGVKLIVNTRSFLALRRAGIPESEWNLVNKTGDAITEAKITERLARNELTEEGIDAIRITGSGKNASSLE